MRGVYKNLMGVRSGKLTVIGGPMRHPTTKGAHWECVCDCGNKTKSYLPSSAITRQTTKSCGCLVVENVGAANSTHRMTATPTYISWRQMWQRCTNPNHKSYQEYKFRTPVQRWLSFERFLDDMGERPTGMSLERIDNNKGYSQENCRWADSYEQQGNTSRNIYVFVDEEKMCIKAACRAIEIPYPRVKARIRAGYSVLEALTKVCRVQKNNSGTLSFDLSKHSLSEYKGTLMPNGVFVKGVAK